MFYVKAAGSVSTPKTPLDCRDGAVSGIPRPLGNNWATSSSAQSLLSSHSTHLTTSQVAFDWARNTNPFQRLRNLLTLDKNWDGYGAPPFLRPQVARAFDLYSNIHSYYLSREMIFSRLSPFIAPCSNGAILFEWAGRRFPNRELEIFVPSAMESPLEFLRCADDLEEEGTFIADEVHILLNWLFATEN